MRTRIESHRTTEKNCFMCIILLLLVLTYDFIGMGALDGPLFDSHLALPYRPSIEWRRTTSCANNNYIYNCNHIDFNLKSMSLIFLGIEYNKKKNKQS